MPSQTAVSDRVANAFERAGITSSNDQATVLQQLADRGVTSADNQAMVLNWAGRLRTALEGGGDTYRLLEGLSASSIENYGRLSDDNKRIFIQQMVLAIADDLKTASGTGQDFFRSSVAEHFDTTMGSMNVASGIIARISRWFSGGTPAPVEAPAEVPATEETPQEPESVFADMGQEDFLAMVDGMVAGQDIFAVAEQALAEEGVAEEEIPLRLLGIKMALAASGMQMDFFGELSEDPPADEQELSRRVDSFRSNADGATTTIAQSDPAWSAGRDQRQVLQAGFGDLGILLAALAVPAIIAAVRTSFSSIGERAYTYFYENAPRPRRGQITEEAKVEYARERTQQFLTRLAQAEQTGSVESVFRELLPNNARMTAEQFRRDILGITSSSQAVINGELASINSRVALLRQAGASFDIEATGTRIRVLPDIPGQPIRNVIARTFRPTATFVVDGWRSFSEAEPKMGFRTFMLAVGRTALAPGYLGYESLRMAGQTGRTFRERATAVGGVAVATWLLLSTFEVTPGPIDIYRGIRGLFTGSPAQRQSGQVSPEATAPSQTLTPGGGRTPAAPPNPVVGQTATGSGSSGGGTQAEATQAPAAPTSIEQMDYDALQNETRATMGGGVLARLRNRLRGYERDQKAEAFRSLIPSMRAGGATEDSLTTLLDQWIAEHPAE